MTSSQIAFTPATTSTNVSAMVAPMPLYGDTTDHHDRPAWIKKYRYATLVNISNKKIGRNVTRLYLDVVTRLSSLRRERRGGWVYE